MIASARRESDVEDLRRAGLQHVIQLDLADSDSIRRAVAQALALSDGRLAALFNNAGYGQPGAVEDLSREALRCQFETNLFGWVELIGLLMPGFLQQPSARIVQNSSVLGVVAMRFRGAYNASKFALEGLTDTLRLELAGTSVKAVLIEPGPIASRFRENALSAFRQHIRWSESRFAPAYSTLMQRLEQEGPIVPFTLGPEAVTAALIRALESNHPKARYRVTFPTRLFALLKRLLPARWLDAIARRY